MAAEGEPLVGEQCVGRRVVELGPLELDEDDLVRDRRRPLLRPRHQGAVHRVLGVDREPQSGIRAGAAEQLTDRFHVTHELGEPRGIELGDPAPVLREVTRETLGLVEEAVGARGAVAVDQRLQVPGDISRGAIDVGAGSFSGGHAGTSSPGCRTGWSGVRRESAASTSASGSGAACTSDRLRVARVRTT